MGVNSVATRHRLPCPVKENKWAYEAIMAPRLKKLETRNEKDPISRKTFIFFCSNNNVKLEDQVLCPQ